jgi:hypothetical protein
MSTQPIDSYTIAAEHRLINYKLLGARLVMHGLNRRVHAHGARGAPISDLPNIGIPDPDRLAHYSLANIYLIPLHLKQFSGWRKRHRGSADPALSGSPRRQ